MEPIIPVKEWCSIRDGKLRNMVRLKTGEIINRSRLVMMNFLHTAKIPTKILVHHNNENTLDDDLGNLLLMKFALHAGLHHPRDFKYGISQAEDKIQYQKLFKAANPDYREKQKECMKKYWVKTKETRREKRNQYYIKNRERILKQKHDYYLETKGKERT